MVQAPQWGVPIAHFVIVSSVQAMLVSANKWFWCKCLKVSKTIEFVHTTLFTLGKHYSAAFTLHFAKTVFSVLLYAFHIGYYTLQFTVCTFNFAVYTFNFAVYCTLCTFNFTAVYTLYAAFCSLQLGLAAPPPPSSSWWVAIQWRYAAYYSLHILQIRICTNTNMYIYKYKYKYEYSGDELNIITWIYYKHLPCASLSHA